MKGRSALAAPSARATRGRSVLAAPSASRAMGAAIVLAGMSAAIAGCGATTVRVTAAPTLDDAARVGFESTLSIGIGWPLDFSGRSHHFVQARGVVGGGLDRATDSGVVLSGGELDFIYWGEPHLDARFGLHFGYRKTVDRPSRPDASTMGLHLAALPIVWTSGSSWMVPQLVVGPELRAEYVWDGANPARAIVSLPLVIEGNFLAAGD